MPPKTQIHDCIYAQEIGHVLACLDSINENLKEIKKALSGMSPKIPVLEEKASTAAKHIYAIWGIFGTLMTVVIGALLRAKGV